MQLPPQFGAYPPNYYYPINIVPYPPGPVPPSPRVPRRSVSPRPVPVSLHPLLTSVRNKVAHWSVTDDPDLARNNPHAHGPEFIHPSILDEPATTPELQQMTLVSDDFPWTITLQAPSNQFISVRMIFNAIYGSLQEPLSHDEWDALSRNAKTNAHRLRCVRLARMPARYAMPNEVLAVRRIDSLAEKTVFSGIQGLGDPVDPSEWNVKLGYTSDRDARRR